MKELYLKLEKRIWNYLEIGQYENPIDADRESENISEAVSDAVHNSELTKEELHKLNEIYDTGVEWEVIKSEFKRSYY